MRNPPHYLRFARSLALVGAIGVAACGDDDKQGATDTVADTSPDTVEDTVADTADTAVDCDACECGAGASQACIDSCCIAVGPLYPPDMPA